MLRHLGFGMDRLMEKRFFVGGGSASKCYTTVVGSRADMTEGSSLLGGLWGHRVVRPSDGALFCLVVPSKENRA